MKNLLVVMVICFSISCREKGNKEEAISIKDGIRKEIGLLPIDNKLTLDSSFRFLPLHPDFLIVDQKLAENDNTSEYYVVDYYTDRLKNLNKVVFYKSYNGKLEVVKEEDKYTGESNKSVHPFLIFSYSFKEKEKSFRIDSLPTGYLKRVNEEKLNFAIKEAKAANMEICGTAAKNILEQGFPKKHTFIKEQEFKKIRAEFVKRMPAPNET